MALNNDEMRYRQMLKGAEEAKQQTYNAQLRIAASPLPPPDKDTRQPVPTKRPGQSPWLPGKSPAVPGQGLAHHNPDQPDNILNHILYDSNGDMWGVHLPGEEPRELKPADREKIKQEQLKHQQSMMISDTRNLQKGPHPYMTGVDEAVGKYPGRNAPADLRIAPLRKGVKAYQQQRGLA